jgi:hypothetical protein
MKVFFITRFSIYDSKFRGFRITTDFDEKEYERRLFSKERLNDKINSFKNITMPSILKQSINDWEWLIYISDRLPEEYVKMLRATVVNYKNIKLIAVKDFKDFFEHQKSYNYGHSFATVRIDDDDGLSNIFAEKVQQYSKDVGKIVCFTQGTLAKYYNDRILLGAKISERNNAQGLVGIGLNIYCCGRHSDIDNRYNVIYDNTPDMFLLTCSPYTDTRRGFSAFERHVAKAKRLFFLIFNHPREVPKECAAFVRKRLPFK